MIRFTKEKVLLLHQLIAQETRGSIGVRDEGLLESALDAVFSGFQAGVVALCACAGHEGDELAQRPGHSGQRAGHGLHFGALFAQLTDGDAHVHGDPSIAFFHHYSMRPAWTQANRL